MRQRDASRREGVLSVCYAVTCRVCGNATWDGCGQHVDDVMRSVPPAHRCRCVKKTGSPPTIPAIFRRRRRG
ncbi:hypothetical protein BST17_00100 [Mycolicibacterium bacteremicum]|uniref:Uncharacterized protein n=1 Tax=Mycolicibacterium bacteremicum TaxID=564198 RepID=A0A1W9Z3M1_MYCBA|nr:hypothetical protein BST17_00100 [Mycolicibacterium bacteremicum]